MTRFLKQVRTSGFSNVFRKDSKFSMMRLRPFSLMFSSERQWAVLASYSIFSELANLSHSLITKL